jgi:hypothetical protein|tara:strand:- start:390 stop:803 length:414 start_codon:yes stop_codon:yes gene_type:complete
MGRVFFNTRENLDTDSITGTTTYVMTEADSGKTFMVSGGTQAVTLLPAASMVEGWNCRFVTTASPSGDKTIGAGSAVISGSCQDAGNGVGCGTDGTAVSNIIIEAASQAGNWLEIMCDGSAYYFNASASQDSAFTTS